MRTWQMVLSNIQNLLLVHPFFSLRRKMVRCRSVFRTLREKRISTRFNKYEEIEENGKIHNTCIRQDSNLAPPCL